MRKSSSSSSSDDDIDAAAALLQKRQQQEQPLKSRIDWVTGVWFLAGAVVFGFLFLGGGFLVSTWYYPLNISWTGSYYNVDAKIKAPTIESSGDVISSAGTLNNAILVNTAQTSDLLYITQTIDFLRGNISNLTAGPPGPAGPPGVNGVDGTLDPSISNIVYVMTNANASIATGQLDRPFKTIKAAYDSILDATTTKRYGIMVFPGRYDEPVTFEPKPWIWLVGVSHSAIRITTPSDITLHSSFGTLGNYRFGFENILISGSFGVNFDLQTVGGSGSTVFETKGTHINNAFTFIGRSTADFVESRRNQYLGQVSVRGLSFLLDGDKVFGGLSVSDVNVTGVNGVLGNIVSSKLSGVVSFTKTLDKNYQLLISGCDTIEVSSFTVASTGGVVSGNMSISTDIISIPSASSSPIGPFPFVNWSLKSSIGSDFIRTSVQTLNATGELSVGDSSVNEFTRFMVQEQPPQFSVGKVRVSDLLPGVGYVLRSTSGSADSNLRIAVQLSSPIIIPNT